jgi:multiple sugar transport system ATP-binding protein
MTMSDRVMVIDAGEALQIASPKDIYEDPDDLRVARFVGTPRINVLPAVARADGIEVLGMTVPLRSGLTPGAPLQVAVRPARLVASRDQEGIKGQLVHQEYLGSDLFLHIGVAGLDAPLIARCDPQVAHAFALGNEITLSASTDHMLLFGNDGRRLRPPSASEPGHG